MGVHAVLGEVPPSNFVTSVHYPSDTHTHKNKKIKTKKIKIKSRDNFKNNKFDCIQIKYFAWQKPL